MTLALPLWLLCKPSAWHDWVQTTAPDQAPEFGLLDLRVGQWTALSEAFTVLFAWVTLASLGSVCLLVMSDGNWVRGGWYALAAGLVGGGLSLAFSLALGLVLGPLISLTGGLAAGMDAYWPDSLALAVGLSFGFAGSVIALASQPTVTLSQYQLLKNMAEGLAGLILAGLILLTGIYAVRWSLVWLLSAPEYALYIWVLGMVAAAWLGIGLTSGTWWQSAVWALAFGLLLGGSVYGMNLADEDDWFRALAGAGFMLSTLTLCFGLVFLLAHQTWGALVAGLLALLAAYQWVLPGGDKVLPALVIGLAIGVTQGIWRPALLWPFELAFALLLRRRDALGIRPWQFTYHPALWDESQWLKFYGLDDYLLWLHDQDPKTAENYITRLAAGAQAWAAQAAQAGIYQQRLAQVYTLDGMQTVWQDLPQVPLEGGKHWHRFGQISRSLGYLEPSPLHRQRQITAAAAQTDQLRRELLSIPTLAKIADAWHVLLSAEVARLAEQLARDAPIPKRAAIGSRYIATLFAGRRAMIAELQALFESPQPPALLIYGQRRIGKTWLLEKLTDGALPQHYAPVRLDFQEIASARSHARLFEAIARRIQKTAQARELALPTLNQVALQEEPFLTFSDWLEDLEACQNITWLLLFDEFEHLEKPFQTGVLARDLVLGLLRHIIQYRRAFHVVLVGWHHLNIYPAWLSYLVNLQVRRLGYLTADETQDLIDKFARDYGIEYQESAVTRIIELSRGHPFWAHALCEEIIAVKNAQPMTSRYSVTDTDVESVLSLVFEHRIAPLSNFFQEERSPEEQALLKRIAQSPDGLALSNDDPTVHRLQDSEAIEESAQGRYRVQLELLRLWLNNRH